MSDRTILRINAFGRAAIGLGFMLAPTLTARGWIGRDAESEGTKVFIRAMGARDVAIAVGTLAALGGRGSLRPWLLGAALADTTDALASLSAGDALTPRQRVPAVAVATSAAATDLLLAARLD